MTRRSLRIAAISSGISALVLALAATGALAQPAQSRSPCAADASKLCSGVKPGGGARFKCLVDHESELTPECKSHMDAMKAHAKELVNACQDDAESLCAGVKPGKGAIMRCLADHESQLTPDCAAHVKQAQQNVQKMKGKMKEAKQKFVEACRADIVKSCPGIEPGDGRIIQCLRAHQDAISPECKQELP